MHRLLERGSVFVHLDPRRAGVSVPDWLAAKPQLVLQIGLNFAIPIHDLAIDEEGVRCTLSFNRSPFFCVLPWSAVYALVAEDGQVTVWPSEIPVELVPASGPAVRRDSPKERRPGQSARARISVVPPPPALDGSAPNQTSTKRPPSLEPVPTLPKKPSLRPPQRTTAPRALPALALDTAQENGDDATNDKSDSANEKPEPPRPGGGGGRPSRRPLPPYLRLVK